MFKSVFIREEEPYTKNKLIELFGCVENDKSKSIINYLRALGILKVIKKENVDSDIMECYESEIIDLDISDSGYFYKFSFVGIVIVFDIILKVYPKYLKSNKEPINELKQVIKVIEKYDSSSKIINMYNGTDEESSFNLLAVMLYLINDYMAYGIYSNEQVIIENNGKGEIVWERTINDTFAIFANKKPFYIDLKTLKREKDEYDYFKRLHECVLTIISKELKESHLSELFEIDDIELSDEELNNFGDLELILYNIEKELRVQFNTRKQLLLKTIYAYISNNKTISKNDGISIYGTNSFNVIWEKVCAKIFGNKLDQKINQIDNDIKCEENNKKLSLIEIIEKPMWTYAQKTATKTLVPDTITIYNDNKNKYFVIIDAKYYVPRLEAGEIPIRQPGIDSITKQFLYQLAYKKLIEDNGYEVRNIFILPTEEENIIDKSSVTMEMFTKEPLKLEPIHIKFIPAKMAYDLYLRDRLYENLNDLLNKK